MGTQVVSPSQANGSFTYQHSATKPDDKLIALHDTIHKLRIKYGRKKVKKCGKKDLLTPMQGVDRVISMITLPQSS